MSLSMVLEISSIIIIIISSIIISIIIIIIIVIFNLFTVDKHTIATTKANLRLLSNKVKRN